MDLKGFKRNQKKQFKQKKEHFVLNFRLDFASQHPAKLRFENTINKKTLKQAWRFF
jgi:hypothetical protein